MMRAILIGVVLIGLVLIDAMLIDGWLGLETGSTASADGLLRFSIRDEASGDPVVARFVVTPIGQDRAVHIRRCQAAGTGVILDREADISLRDGNYQFRLIRGPEYRIINGTFALEKLSDDSKSVALPRMVNMYAEGWVSGDALVPVGKGDLPLRMAGEDLHVSFLAAPKPDREPRRPRHRDDPITHQPIWIQHGVVANDAFVIYPADEPSERDAAESNTTATTPREILQTIAADESTDTLITAKKIDGVRVAAADPFDWRMPIWLASGKLDGVFVMGDWLRTDRDVKTVRRGREVASELIGTENPGRWAEFIYHQMLEAGFEIPPLAGGGSNTGDTPLGYNRVYVAPAGDDGGAVQSFEQWNDAMWRGRSMLTNGPMLRCRMNGESPGHRFEIDQTTRFEISLDLAVRDSVDYLDVIHNGKIFYSAALDEFAKSGGRLPPIQTDQPGWVIVRVVTKHPDHYRFAMSSPWYIRAGGRKRVAPSAVAFWKTWLKQYENRLVADREQIEREGKYIRATRKFWSDLESSIPHQ